MLKIIYIPILFVIFCTCVFGETIGLVEKELNWESNKNTVKNEFSGVKLTHAKQRFDAFKEVRTTDLFKDIRNIEKEIDKDLSEAAWTEQKVKEYEEKIDKLENKYVVRFARCFALLNETLDGSGLEYAIDINRSDFHEICNQCRQKLYPEDIKFYDYVNLINDLGKRTDNIDKNDKNALKALKQDCDKITKEYYSLNPISGSSIKNDMQYLLDCVENNNYALNTEVFEMERLLDCQEKINNFYSLLTEEIDNINKILERVNCQVYYDDQLYKKYNDILEANWSEFDPFENKIKVKVLNHIYFDSNSYNDLISVLKLNNRYDLTWKTVKNINFEEIKKNFANIEKKYQQLNIDFYKLNYIKDIRDGKSISTTDKEKVEISKMEAEDLLDAFINGEHKNLGINDYIREINNDLEDINVECFIDENELLESYKSVLDKKINWTPPSKPVIVTKEEQKKNEERKSEITVKIQIRRNYNTDKVSKNTKTDNERRSGKLDKKKEKKNKNSTRVNTVKSTAEKNKDKKKDADTSRNINNQNRSGKITERKVTNWDFTDKNKKNNDVINKYVVEPFKRLIRKNNRQNEY